MKCSICRQKIPSAQEVIVLRIGMEQEIPTCARCAEHIEVLSESDDKTRIAESLDYFATCYKQSSNDLIRTYLYDVISIAGKELQREETKYEVEAPVDFSQKASYIDVLSSTDTASSDTPSAWSAFLRVLAWLNIFAGIIGSCALGVAFSDLGGLLCATMIISGTILSLALSGCIMVFLDIADDMRTARRRVELIADNQQMSE